jgi:hypothetical protein
MRRGGEGVRDIHRCKFLWSGLFWPKSVASYCLAALPYSTRQSNAMCCRCYKL